MNENIINLDLVRREKTISQEIDIDKLTESKRKLRTGLLAAATENTDYLLAGEHTSEPIKDLNTINEISCYLLDNQRYRDNMLFIVGINFGLRVSDLLSLRLSHLITDDFSFKSEFPILEKKTQNTRKAKKNRYITINLAVMEAVTLYLENTNGCCLSDYLFRSESNNGKADNKALSRKSVDRILKGIGKELHLDVKIATHTLRKTFAYHQMVMSNNDPRKLLLLQRMFGHSTSAQTLEYIGITGEEISEAYCKLNLGSKLHYLIDSYISDTTSIIM